MQKTLALLFLLPSFALGAAGVSSGKQVVSDLSSLPVTAKDIDGTSVPRSVKTRLENIQAHTSGWVNAASYPFTGAGLALAASAAATANAGLLIAHPIAITSAVGTISVPVRFEGGGSLTVAAGYRVDLAGTISAPPSRVFYGQGFVTTSGGSFDPRWWGRPSLFAGDVDSILHVTFDKPGTWGTYYGPRGEVVTVARSTTAPFLLAGAESSVAANLARVDEDGLLVEPGTTNVLVAPSTFSDGSWTKGQVTAITGAAAPDGTPTAFTITDNAVSAAHQLYVLPTFTTATWAWSVYAKQGTGSAPWLRLADNSSVHSAWFNLSTGAVGTVGGAGSRGEIESVGSGWYRCSLMAPESAGGSLASITMSPDGVSASYVGTGSTVLLWRAQLEANEYATSWTSGTRAAEEVVIPLPTALGGEWTVEIAATPMGAQSWNRGALHPLFALGQYTAQNSMAAYAASGTLVVSIYDGAGAERKITSAALAAGSFYLGERRLAASSSGVSLPASYVDGRQVSNAPTGTGTGVYLGTAAQQLALRLGSTLVGTSLGPVGGFKIREVRVVNSRLPPGRPLGAYSYAWAFTRGFRPASGQVAFLGDSVTQGIYDASITKPFPRGVADAKGGGYWGHNFGIGASTSAQCLERWRSDVRGRFSKMVLLAGINDVNNWVPTETTIANLKAIIDEALADGMTVVPVTLLPGGQTAGSAKRIALDAVNAWLTTYSATKGLALVNAYASFDDGAGKMQAALDVDGGSLHPSQTGLNLLATLIAPVVP